MLTTRWRDKCGIIYCLSRKDCERLAESLRRNHGVRCDFYHADIPHARRKEIQRRWMQNEIQVIIATIAFGMGINKSDVLFWHLFKGGLRVPDIESRSFEECLQEGLRLIEDRLMTKQESMFDYSYTLLCVWPKRPEGGAGSDGM